MWCLHADISRGREKENMSMLHYRPIKLLLDARSQNKQQTNLELFGFFTLPPLGIVQFLLPCSIRTITKTCETSHNNHNKNKVGALWLPVHFSHFTFLLRELSLQGKDFLLELSHLIWIDALRAHLGSPQFLHLCFQLWCWTQATG